MRPRLLAAMVLLLAAPVLAGCSSPAKPPAPNTFDINGTITLGLGNVTRSYAPAGAGCQGTVFTGLTDMVGMQIVAIDSAGKVAQAGTIEKGLVKWVQITDPGADGYPEQAHCVLPFTIDNVMPSKKDLYKLRVKGLTDSDYYPASELTDVQLKPTAI